jgi:hypothetical protein
MKVREIRTIVAGLVVNERWISLDLRLALLV